MHGVVHDDLPHYGEMPNNYTAFIILHTKPATRQRLPCQSVVRYSSRNRCWWYVRTGAIRFVCSLRHGRPPHSSAAPGALLWHNWFGTSMVPVLTGWPSPIRPNWFVSFVSSADSVLRNTGVGPWTDPDLVVHCWLATAYWGLWSLPSPVCRWHPSLWTLSSVCNAWASEHPLYLYRWCSQVDALQPATAEYCKDRGYLVYIQSTPPSATSVTHPSGYQQSHARFRCPQPWHLHGRWCVNEVAHFKESSCLFCDSAST